jgi:hypothetical protein
MATEPGLEPTVIRPSKERVSTADLEACRSWLVARGDSLARSREMILMVDELLERRSSETCEQLMSGLTESQREQATESLITIINVSSALEKKTPKELVDLVLGELAAMEVTSVQELLIEELCTRVHPNWCNEEIGEPNTQKAGERRDPLAATHVLDRKITVCDKCLCACCWHGEFMCDEAKYAGTVEKTIRELLVDNVRESCEYWFKSPNNGDIDQEGLATLRRWLKQRAALSEGDQHGR